MIVINANSWSNLNVSKKSYGNHFRDLIAQFNHNKTKNFLLSLVSYISCNLKRSFKCYTDLLIMHSSMKKKAICFNLSMLRYSKFSCKFYAPSNVLDQTVNNVSYEDRLGILGMMIFKYQISIFKYDKKNFKFDSKLLRDRMQLCNGRKYFISELLPLKNKYLSRKEN
ncbi:hypothetical protein BpHYR1_001245 [Brachionus plicatilis]|uniref:Uncharacterized protein n=1 Tax=Brachionus plicatilis TaxID=10195 RepID=A0A3M7S528_BRAPC|nr:hypothetical protein BpHYR1_001245 [Brachionus plicatilis]